MRRRSEEFRIEGMVDSTLDKIILLQTLPCWCVLGATCSGLGSGLTKHFMDLLLTFTCLFAIFATFQASIFFRKWLVLQERGWSLSNKITFHSMAGKDLLTEKQMLGTPDCEANAWSRRLLAQNSQKTLSWMLAVGICRIVSTMAILLLSVRKHIGDSPGTSTNWTWTAI